jgi:undecaprenyl-diphosphatase
MANRLDSFWIKWGIAVIVAALLSALAARYAYFPGDVEVTRFLQSLFPRDLRWAQLITASAGLPWNFALLALTVAVSWLIAGRRAALLAIASFAVLSALDPSLKSLIERPRPSPELVRVVGSPRGYSFPSGFALTYAATFGYLLLLSSRRPDGRQKVVMILCLLLLIAGGVARTLLGAHWPSDVLGGYLIGFTWVALLMRFFRR